MEVDRHAPDRVLDRMAAVGRRGRCSVQVLRSVTVAWVIVPLMMSREAESKSSVRRAFVLVFSTVRHDLPQTEAMSCGLLPPEGSGNRKSAATLQGVASVLITGPPCQARRQVRDVPPVRLSAWSQGTAAAVDRGGKDAYFRLAFFSTQAVISSISGPWASMIFRAMAFASSLSPYFSSTSAMAMAPA